MSLPASHIAPALPCSDSLRNDLSRLSRGADLVFSSLGEGLLVLDTDLKPVLANNKARSLFQEAFGFALEESIPLQRQVPPAYRPWLEDALQHTLQGEPGSEELKVLSPSGPHWLHCRYFPVEEKSGICGITVLVSDCTSRKLEEQQEKDRRISDDKLYQGRLLFENFMENAPLTAWVTDTEGRLQYMNSPFLRLFNLTREHFGITHWELFGQELGNAYQANNLEVLREGRTIETIERSKKGESEAIYKVYKFPLLFHGELMVGGWSVEITEQLELKERLLKEEKNKKKLLVRSIIETQEKERRQLSVELHDNVNQILSSCKLMLEVARENREAAGMLTEKSYQSIQTAIKEIRKISHDLNPSSIEDVGLVDAITDMLEGIRASGRFTILFYHEQYDPAKYLRFEDKIAVYRIVQEQVNNIIRHAQASAIIIRLYSSKSKIYLSIEDDGIGFDARKFRSGLGLKSIRHRVDYYNGKLSIKTRPGHGCKMKVLLYIR